MTVTERREGGAGSGGPGTNVVEMAWDPITRIVGSLGIYAKIDFQVRGVAQLGSGAGASRNQLPESLLATIRRVPGVELANGQITGYAQFVARNGKAIATGGGAPTIGVAFDPDQRMSPLHLTAGGPPVAADDVVMDAGTAQKYHFAVGQQVRIISAGLPPRFFTITGIAQFNLFPIAPEQKPNLAGVADHFATMSNITPSITYVCDDDPTQATQIPTDTAVDADNITQGTYVMNKFHKANLRTCQRVAPRVAWPAGAAFTLYEFSIEYHPTRS